MTPERQDLRALVIDEVDEARDIYALALQLEPHMPIESFDHLAKAVGDERLTFRDTAFDVESLRGLLPDIAFPAKDTQALVSRLGQLIRTVPQGLGVDTESEAGARRISRMRGDLIPGMLTRPDNSAAVAVKFGGAQDLPADPGYEGGK